MEIRESSEAFVAACSETRLTTEHLRSGFQGSGSSFIGSGPFLDAIAPAPVISGRSRLAKPHTRSETRLTTEHLRMVWNLEITGLLCFSQFGLADLVRSDGVFACRAQRHQLHHSARMKNSLLDFIDFIDQIKKGLLGERLEVQHQMRNPEGWGSEFRGTRLTTEHLRSGCGV